MPDDVDPSDEGAFRMQIKDLACTVCVSSVLNVYIVLKGLVCFAMLYVEITISVPLATVLLTELIFYLSPQSLELLKTAIFDKECEPRIRLHQFDI